MAITNNFPTIGTTQGANKYYIPQLTSTPRAVIISGSSSSGSLYNICNGTTSSVTISTTEGVTIDFGELIIPKRFTLARSSTKVDYTITGSTNGTNWNEIFSGSTEGHESTDEAFNQLMSCRYINILGASNLSIVEFNITNWEKDGVDLWGKYLPTFSVDTQNTCQVANATLSLDSSMTHYSEGQIVNITIPQKLKLVEIDYVEKEFTSNPFPAATSMSNLQTAEGYLWEIGQGSGYDNYTSWKAFDNDSSTNFKTLSSDTYGVASLEALTKDGVKIMSIKPTSFTLKYSGAHTGFRVKGTRIDGTVDTLYTHSGDSTSFDGVVSVETEYYYTTFSFSGAGKTGSPCYIYTGEITSGTMRYGVQEEKYVDSIFYPKLNINGLGDTIIKGELVKGGNYSLIYSQGAWEVKRDYQIMFGTYMGGFDSSAKQSAQSIYLGFTPQMVTVWGTSGGYSYTCVKDMNGFGTNGVNGTTNNSYDLVFNTSSYGRINIIEGGFEATGSDRYGYNAGNSLYYYMAIY